MPHKACFHCNLLFEVAGAHAASVLPCPTCGQILENYLVTEETPLEAPIGAPSVSTGRGAKVATTMFRLPTHSQSTGSIEEDGPTRALDSRALRAGRTGAVPPGRAGASARSGRFDSEAPTRALDARALAAGAPADVDEDAPTRALDAQKLRQAAQAAQPAPVDEDAPTRALDAQKLRQAVQVPAAGPPPPGGVQGVSGPIPKRRARAEPPRRPPTPPPPPEAPEPAPSPARRHRPPVEAARPEPARPADRRSEPARPADRRSEPARPSDRRSGRAQPPPERAEIPRPATRPPPAPRPMPRTTPRGAEPEVPPYFEESRAVEVPDALGSLIARQQPSAPAERPTMVPRPTAAARPRPVALYIGLAAVLGLGAGAIFLVATRDPEAASRRADGGAAAGAPEAPPAWRDGLIRALDKAQVRLPEAPLGDALIEADFVVAGPDGVTTHKGPVVGLLSAPIPDEAIERDDGGEAVRPLLAALGQPERERLNVGLDRRATARTAARLLYTAWRAGYRHASLLVRRADGELVALEVAPHRPGTPLPAAGGVVLRVGQLALSAVVEGRDGRVVGDRPPPVPRDADGAIDTAALDALLDELASNHPRVRDAVVHVNGDLALDALAAVLSRVRGSATRDRFPSIALSVQ